MGFVMRDKSSRLSLLAAALLIAACVVPVLMEVEKLEGG